MKDLLKTIQIQLCMKKSELSAQTIKKLIIMHQTLPILNVQFLHLLISTYNHVRAEQNLYKTYKMDKFDVHIFNLNISMINLTMVQSPEIIDAYETALSFELEDMARQSLQ